MSLLAGEIVLIPDAPFTNYLSAKARPCLVVSGTQFNNDGPDVILAPISSVVRPGDPKQIVVDSGHSGFP